MSHSTTNSPATSSEEVLAETQPVPSPDDSRSDFNPLSAPATYALLLANFAVFFWMFPHGPGPELWRDHHRWSIFIGSFSPEQLMMSGAAGTIAILNGQWFRLVTAAFVHVNPLHLLSNMWCLWNLGLLGEPLIGPIGLIAVYILTGAAGFLLSLACNICLTSYYHQPLLPNVTAGASGAVFGIAGLLIILLSNRKLPVPWIELRRHRTAVLIFSILNLLIGGVSIFFSFVRVDNAAHLGGFICGLGLGLAVVSQMMVGKRGYVRRQKVAFIAAAFVLSLFGYWIVNLV